MNVLKGLYWQGMWILFLLCFWLYNWSCVPPPHDHPSTPFQSFLVEWGVERAATWWLRTHFVWSLTFFQSKVCVCFAHVSAFVCVCVSVRLHDRLTRLALWRGALLFARGALRFTPVTSDTMQEWRQRWNVKITAGWMLFCLLLGETQSWNSWKHLFGLSVNVLGISRNACKFAATGLFPGGGIHSE